MKIKYLGVLLIIFSTLITSSAQLLFKIGSASLELNIISLITNWYLIIGLILYGLGFLLVIRALKEGEVTKLYPILTLSYLWIMISSYYILSESINILKWIGVFFIISGIILININNTKTPGVV